MNTEKLAPARLLGVGYFIREQMEYRNWDVQILSRQSGLDVLALNELLDNNDHLTEETAIALAIVFGGSCQYWMNLDVNYKNKISK